MSACFFATRSRSRGFNIIHIPAQKEPASEPQTELLARGVVVRESSRKDSSQPGYLPKPPSSTDATPTTSAMHTPNANIAISVVATIRASLSDAPMVMREE